MKTLYFNSAFCEKMKKLFFNFFFSRFKNLDSLIARGLIMRFLSFDVIYYLLGTELPCAACTMCPIESVLRLFVRGAC